MIKGAVYLFFLLLVSGCASSTYIIDSQNYSLGELKKILIGLTGEPRKVSENQRTLYSRYFSRKNDPKFDPEKSAERLYAKIAILGDRRPYDVEVQVIIEAKDEKNYVDEGPDEIETNKLGRDIKIRLNQSREDRNVIDDFRAF